MKQLLLWLGIFFLFSFVNVQAQISKTAFNHQTTWTYTYLKAKENQRENLKEFIRQNWFVMDSIAVSQGIFKSYELIENISTADSLRWDLIVAVEYFTEGTYSDIREPFEKIRSAHQTKLVNGLGFRDLGAVIGSETVQKRPNHLSERDCEGSQYEIVKPFIGLWEEYAVENDAEQLFGMLDISINTNGCNITKEFLLFNKPFSYVTTAYFDQQQNAWIEIFTFQNGKHAIFKWIKAKDGVLMERIGGSSQPEYLHRNRWTNIKTDSFEILEERSYDSGKSWEVYSTTRLKRK